MVERRATQPLGGVLQATKHGGAIAGAIGGAGGLRVLVVVCLYGLTVWWGVVSKGTHTQAVCDRWASSQRTLRKEILTTAGLESCRGATGMGLEWCHACYIDVGMRQQRRRREQAKEIG